MKTPKEMVKDLLDTLSDDSTFDDIRYHIFVVEKIRKGVERAATEATIPQSEVERRFGKRFPR